VQVIKANKTSYTASTKPVNQAFILSFGWIIAAQGGAFWSFTVGGLINIYLIFHALKLHKSWS